MSAHRALVVTASTRAAAGVWEDRSGTALRDGLVALELIVDGPVVVPDGDEVERALREGVAAGYHLIVTTGGTGLTPTDLTPEMTLRVIEREIPGIPEALRADGISRGIPTAMLSRGVAGTTGQTLIINLPGSPGGVRDGLEVLGRVLRHALEQIPGSDHSP